MNKDTESLTGALRGARSKASWAALGVGLFLAGTAAHATVILGVGAQIGNGTYNATYDSSTPPPNNLGPIFHAQAAATAISVGSASVGSGPNPNCTLPGGCFTSATSHADAEVDTNVVVFRADAGAGTTSASNGPDVAAGAGFQLYDTITPTNSVALAFYIHLDWAFLSQSTGSGGVFNLFKYSITIDDPNCQNQDGCDYLLFDFAADNGTGSGSTWSYFGAGGGSGTDNAKTLDIVIPYSDLNPFDIYIQSELSTNCGVDIDPQIVGDCVGRASAFKSAYTGIQGDFSSANGYGYTGFAAAGPGPGPDPDPNTVPEPTTWILFATGLLGLLAGCRQRRLA
jgi:hypothetical protein